MGAAVIETTVPSDSYAHPTPAGDVVYETEATVVEGDVTSEAVMESDAPMEAPAVPDAPEVDEGT
jgi:hypothetical protein